VGFSSDWRNLQSLDFGESTRLRIETEKVVAPEKSRRDNVEDVVSSEAMLRGMACRDFLEERLECRNLDSGTVYERFSRQIFSERFKGYGSVLRRHSRLTALLSEPNRHLKSIGQLYPMKPRDREPRCTFAFRDGEELVRLFAFRQRQVNPSEEVCVCVGVHSPAMALSSCWTVAAGITPLNIRRLRF
jgi:hypothetical protein